jgi:hydrogenase maturation factor
MRLCAHFGLRPLGLIASGALLLTVSERRTEPLLSALRRMRIQATVIGAVEAGGAGVVGFRRGKRVRFEWSQRDELTRLD